MIRSRSRWKAVRMECGDSGRDAAPGIPAQAGLWAKGLLSFGALRCPPGCSRRLPSLRSVPASIIRSSRHSNSGAAGYQCDLVMNRHDFGKRPTPPRGALLRASSSSPRPRASPPTRVLEAVDGRRSGRSARTTSRKRSPISRRSAAGSAWHFIGHLQKNKARKAVEIFDMIETVDSAELARRTRQALCGRLGQDPARPHRGQQRPRAPKVRGSSRSGSKRSSARWPRSGASGSRAR